MGNLPSDNPSKKVRKIKLVRNVSDLDLPDPSQVKAVALRYDASKDRAPKVLAIGKGTIAAEILRLAEEYRIPLHEDPKLSELLAKLEINSEVPAELYALVAEILAFVYKLNNTVKARRSGPKRK